MEDWPKGRKAGVEKWRNVEEWGEEEESVFLTEWSRTDDIVSSPPYPAVPRRHPPYPRPPPCPRRAFRGPPALRRFPPVSSVSPLGPTEAQVENTGRNGWRGRIDGVEKWPKRGKYGGTEGSSTHMMICLNNTKKLFSGCSLLYRKELLG